MALGDTFNGVKRSPLYRALQDAVTNLEGTHQIPDLIRHFFPNINPAIAAQVQEDVIRRTNAASGFSTHPELDYFGRPVLADRNGPIATNRYTVVVTYDDMDTGETDTITVSIDSNTTPTLAQLERLAQEAILAQGDNVYQREGDFFNADPSSISMEVTSAISYSPGNPV